MNRRMISLRIVASLLIVMVAVTAVACGKKNKTEPATQPTQGVDSVTQADPSATQMPEDAEIQMGVGQRGDYEEEEETGSTRPQTAEKPEATQGEEKPVTPEVPKQPKPEQPENVPEAPEQTKPEVPEQTKPDALEQIKPEGPEQTKPETPVETQPADPEETLPPELMGMTFQQYLEMPIEEQEKFVESFESVKDFVAWWNAAKAYGEKPEDPTLLEGDVVDLGKLNP